MMDEMKWEKLADVYGRLEADMIKSYLEAEGVEVELFQEAIGQLIPTNLDEFGRVQLFVPKEKIEEARKLFEEYQNSTPTDFTEGEEN
jgi:Putative prokaryotic signal transducing protein